MSKDKDNSVTGGVLSSKGNDAEWVGVIKMVVIYPLTVGVPT